MFKSTFTNSPPFHHYSNPQLSHKPLWALTRILWSIFSAAPPLTPTPREPLANFQPILNSTTPRGGRRPKLLSSHTGCDTHGTIWHNGFDTTWHLMTSDYSLNSPRCPYWTMLVQDPWGQGESRGVFCRPRHFFLVSNFLRQLCRRCSTTCSTISLFCPQP